MRSLPRSAMILPLLAVLVLVIIVLGTVPLLLLGHQAQAAPQQPIPFPHVRMVSAGVPCLFCHSGATRSPAAGIPSSDRCFGCHQTILKTSPLIGKLYAYFDQPIPWVRINQLPRFVHFSHEVHVNNGINCEQCHGDIGHMTVTVQAQKFNMGFCLDCHEKQPNGQQLKDCGVCHY